MKHSIITITAILIICASASVSFAQPQPPDTMWTSTFGGTQQDEGSCVLQTNDGGFIIVGYTMSFGPQSVIVIKTDTNGNSIWDMTYRYSTSDQGNIIKQTSDGGYIIIGTGYFFPENNDILLLKVDSQGYEEWHQYLGNEYFSEYGYDVEQTQDGGYILVGRKVHINYSSDVLLIKTNENGYELWNRTFGEFDIWDGGNSIELAVDTGFIITGGTWSYGAGGSDVYVIKTDNEGNEEWHQTFGGNNDDYGNYISRTSNDEYIITGYTESFGNNGQDLYLIKIDREGNELWSRNFGGVYNDVGYCVQNTIDGGYISVGYTQSYGIGYGNIYLVRTDSWGNYLYQNTYGGSSGDAGYFIKHTNDEGYIITGSTGSYGAGMVDIWLLKIEPEGAQILIEPNTIDFGTIEINFPEYVQIVISNFGQGELLISEFLIDYPFSFQIISGDSALSYGDTTVVEITFDPPEIGYYVDSLGIVSNAVNEDTVWVHLEGEGGIVPAPVSGLTIEVQGNDAVLTWNPVDTTIHGNPVIVDYYLIYFETDPYSEFEFLDYTADTVFTHDAVAQFSESMFYEVIAFIGDIEMRIKN